MSNNENINKLPYQELEKLGLFRDGDVKINQPDLSEMLAGRRSDFIELKNLEHNGIFIEKMKAKLSFSEDADGKLSVRVHPVYKNAQKHPLLDEKEMQSLIDQEKPNIVKDHVDAQGKKHKLIIEFDKDTNEFVSLSSNKVFVPEQINNESLTDDQKRKLREGAPIELNDGTVVQTSPTAKKGMRANTKFLILSILLDGGVSYLVVEGLKALFGSKQNEKRPDYNKGFLDAMKEMDKQKWANRNSNFVNFPDDHHKLDLDELKRQNGQQAHKQSTRSYTRGGGSR